MKEFIEKLIEKLEEKYLQAEKDMELSDTYDEASRCGGRMAAYETAQNIANQLAEEYSVTGGWIPCSSGQFPEEYCNVLLTVNHFEEAQKGFLDHGVWYAEDGIKYVPGSVIAWRPLPDLYVPEE